MAKQKLEEAAVRQWLDEIIEAKEKLKGLGAFDKGVRINTLPRTIGMYEGIDLVAEALGAELEERHDESLRFQYCYSFRYKDVEVVQLAENRLERRDNEEYQTSEGGNA